MTDRDLGSLEIETRYLLVGSNVILFTLVMVVVGQAVEFGESLVSAIYFSRARLANSDLFFAASGATAVSEESMSSVDRGHGCYPVRYHSSAFYRELPR